MPNLSDSEVLDLLKGTLKELGKLKFNQIAQELQSYEVLPRIMKKDRVDVQGGIGIQRNLMTGTSDSARHVGLHEVDVVNIPDLLNQISLPWKHTETYWAWDRREPLINTGDAKVVDVVKARRVGGLLSLAELMEITGFSCPTGSTDKAPMGIPYWVLKYPAATTTPGFYGGNHASFTSGPGGLSANTYAKWRNYTGQYTNETKDDMVQKMRDAADYIQFKSPVVGEHQDYSKGNGERFRIYVNHDTKAAICNIGENQNENLGRDIDSMDGTITFRRNPIVWVPKLDADADDPIFMLDWSYWSSVFLRGDYLRESDPRYASQQHNTIVVWLDLTWNLLCTDRRRQACLSKGRTTNGSAALS